MPVPLKKCKPLLEKAGYPFFLSAGCGRCLGQVLGIYAVKGGSLLYGRYGVRYCVAYIKKLPADVAGSVASLVRAKRKGEQIAHYFTCTFAEAFSSTFTTYTPRFTGTLMLLSVALRLRKSLPSAV